MSRSTVTWLVFWIVIACLGLVAWQAIDKPGSSSTQTGGPALGDACPRLPTRHDPRNDSATVGLLRSLPKPEGLPPGLEDAARDEWLKARMDLIDDAAYGEDADSLRLLIVEYGSPLPELARAAHDALLAREDPQAVAYLKEMLPGNLPASKKVEIQQMIEFFNSPSVFESGLDPDQ